MKPFPVAITGIGAVSPAGMTEAGLWRALGLHSGTQAPWPKRPMAAYPTDNVAAISEADWAALLQPFLAGSSRTRALAAFTVDQCLSQAGRSAATDRAGCILASTTAGVEAIEDGVVGLPLGLSVDLDANGIIPERGWTGPVHVVSTACSSGLLALALAIDILQAGEADLMVAGGLDVLLEYTICGFNGLRLATDDRCRPFSAGRKGVVLSEGGAVFCLEPLGAALARGAPVRAVIAGCGLSCDAEHVTAPNVGGIVRSIRQAMTVGGLTPASIGAIFAHGTGTPINDANEVAALRAVFGAVPLPHITSTKSVLGHAQAGAGAFSLVAAVRALETQHMPGTAGLLTLDPALGDLSVPGQEGAALSQSCVLVNAFGFGGNNCVMLVCQQPAAQALAV